METIAWIAGFFILVALGHAAQRWLDDVRADLKVIRKMLQDRDY